ncbi:MAG: hypothetical protein KDK33_14595, partial [Leptospiraceae bacterium]|nr:hypothetical protein [Leptospiraceae bacterium]
GSDDLACKLDGEKEESKLNAPDKNNAITAGNGHACAVEKKSRRITIQLSQCSRNAFSVDWQVRE